jgi:hypothetical protein
VSFVGRAGLSNATCPFVPAGTTISWTGPETASTIVRTDVSGITTVQIVSHASGIATDNNGNRYAFDYSNDFRVSNRSGDPGTFTGTMTDHFSLAGPALQLSNGFVANLTTNLSDVFVSIRSTRAAIRSISPTARLTAIPCNPWRGGVGRCSENTRVIARRRRVGYRVCSGGA